MCIRDRVRYAALSAAILAALGLALAAIFLPGKPAQAQSPVQSADYQQQEPVPPYRYIMKAVSYTHLDVYKRQSGISRAAGCSLQ